MGDGVAPAVPALRSVLLNHPGVWLRAREKTPRAGQMDRTPSAAMAIRNLVACRRIDCLAALVARTISH